MVRKKQCRQRLALLSIRSKGRAGLRLADYSYRFKKIGAHLAHLSLLKPAAFVRLLNWAGTPFAGLYLLCMFAFPWLDGGWQHVQGVWERWQGLNVGMLAFISSLVAFNISTYNAENQRKREFLASKAFLPAALAELVEYFQVSAEVFKNGWGLAREAQVELISPSLPEGYKTVFSECIKHADPHVGDYLSKILVELQVHDSRMHKFASQFGDTSYVNPDRQSLIVYFYKLAELHALVNKLFDFARGEAGFDSSSLQWEDFRNALRNMSIRYEQISIGENMALESFIKRAIERKEKV